MRSMIRAYLWSVRSITIVLAGASAVTASALQPLPQFLSGARTASADERVALLNSAQQEGEALAALGRTLPSATARGVYTRNEFESKIDPAQFGPALPPGVTSTPLVIQPF